MPFVPGQFSPYLEQQSTPRVGDLQKSTDTSSGASDFHEAGNEEEIQGTPSITSIVNTPQEQALTDIEDAISRHLEISSQRSASIMSKSTTSLDSAQYSEDEDRFNPVLLWTPQQVGSWLAMNGLEQELADKFIDNDINGQILLELEAVHLKEIDIKSFGKRFEIMKKINGLKAEVMPKPAYRNRSPLRASRGGSSSTSLGIQRPPRSPQRSPTNSPLRAQTSNFPPQPRTPPQTVKRPTTAAHSDSVLTDRSTTHRRSSSFDPQWVLAKDAANDESKFDTNRSRDSGFVGSDIVPPQKIPDDFSGLGLTGVSGQHRSNWSDPSQTNSDNHSTHSHSRSFSGERNIKKIHTRMGSQDTLRASRDKTHRHKQTNSSMGTLKEIKRQDTNNQKTAQQISLGSPMREPSFKPTEIPADDGTPPRQRQVTAPLVGVNKPLPGESPRKTLRRIKTAPTGLKVRKGHHGLRKVSVENSKTTANHYGWMRKRSERYGTWQSRYFVLRNARLAYYLTEEVCGEHF